MSQLISKKLSLDAVDRDAAQMAAHMLQCETARGAWFAVTGALQRVSAVSAGRLVTVACLGAALIALVTAFV
jgi:hypothetical protein